LAYIQGRFTVDTYVRRYIRVHVCYTHPYIPTLPVKDLRLYYVTLMIRVSGDDRADLIFLYHETDDTKTVAALRFDLQTTIAKLC